MVEVGRDQGMGEGLAILAGGYEIIAGMLFVSGVPGGAFIIAYIWGWRPSLRW
jgi:hypothetical protein